MNECEHINVNDNLIDSCADCGMWEDEARLCMVCGEFEPAGSFEISAEVCKWCDVTIRDAVVEPVEGGITCKTT